MNTYMTDQVLPKMECQIKSVKKTISTPDLEHGGVQLIA